MRVILPEDHALEFLTDTHLLLKEEDQREFSG